MAYITKRGSSYSVRYTYQDEHGKSCDKWESFPTQERSIWEVDEMRAALDSMEDPILHLAVHLTLVGALREGEIVGLTPEDLDFDAADGIGTFRINKSMQRVRKEALNQVDDGCIIKIFPDALDSAAGHSIQSGIYQCHLPWLQHIVVHDHFIFLCKIKCDIAVMKIVICKPLLDHMLLISTADYKFIKTIRRIHLHDVP